MNIKTSIYRLTTSPKTIAIMASLALIGLGLVADFYLTQQLKDPKQTPLIEIPSDSL